MANEHDQFEDFLQGDAAIREGGGILDSQGLRDYENIETSVAAEGAGVVLNCRSCNSKRRIYVEWPELVVLSQNGPGLRPILPPGWKFSENNKTAYVQLQCPKCGQPGFAIHMTPQEAQGHVTAGLASGLIQPPVVNSIVARIQASRGVGVVRR